MIREAIFSDIPAMAKLLKQSHVRSKYATRCGVSDKAIDQLLISLIHGQKQNGPCASFVQVVEYEGEVVGFIAAALSRIYNIGDKLCAAEIFLINESKRLKDTLALIDNYISWAKSNPKVIEVGLSWSDALPNAEDIANIYRRKGADKVGEQFAIRVDLPQVRAA